MCFVIAPSWAKESVNKIAALSLFLQTFTWCIIFLRNTKSPCDCLEWNWMFDVYQIVSASRVWTTLKYCKDHNIENATWALLTLLELKYKPLRIRRSRNSLLHYSITYKLVQERMLCVSHDLYANNRVSEDQSKCMCCFFLTLMLQACSMSLRAFSAAR